MKRIWTYLISLKQSHVCLKSYIKCNPLLAKQQGVYKLQGHGLNFIFTLSLSVIYSMSHRVCCPYVSLIYKTSNDLQWPPYFSHVACTTGADLLISIHLQPCENDGLMLTHNHPPESCETLVRWMCTRFHGSQRGKWSGRAKPLDGNTQMEMKMTNWRNIMMTFNFQCMQQPERVKIDEMMTSTLLSGRRGVCLFG